MPDRHGPLKTPLGRFVASVNDGNVGNGAVVVPLDSDGWGEYAVDDSEVNRSGVVPAGARGGEGISSEDVLVLSEAGQAEVTYELGESGAFFRGADWSPGRGWVAGWQSEETPQWIPSTVWISGTSWVPEDPEDFGFLVPDIEGMMERTGMTELPEGAEIVEEGDTVEAGTVIAATFGGEELYPDGTVTDSSGSPFLPEEPIFPDETLFPSEAYAPDLFDAGASAPMGGVGFGMGVLSTPSAEVAGRDANPLSALSSEDLLTRDETATLLADAGISDAAGAEWLAGPVAVEIDDVEIDYEPPELLGEETDIELFAGVVSGDGAPWGVTLGVARATPDDHVVAIGVNRRPVGTAEGGLAAVRADREVIGGMTELLTETLPDLQLG